MRSVIIYSLWMFGMLVHLQAQTFTASVNKQKVAENEVFEVHFQLEDAQTRDIKYPSFANFRVRGGPNTSTSMQIINGQVSQSVKYSFYLAPTKIGKFQIGVAKAKVNGKTLSTKPITIEVVKAGTKTGRANQAQGNRNNATASQDVMEQIRKNVFLRALVSKSKVYQGEPLTLTYKLYTRVNNMSNPYLTDAPTYKGFWVEELDVNDPPKAEVYKGVQYRTNVVKRVILFPQRPGKLRVEPLKLESNVRVTVQNTRKRRSIFDDFFGQYKDIPYAFGSNPVSIEVKPMPAGKPKDFSGAVGNYKMEVSLDKTSIEAGGSITMKVNISGKGNIKMLSLPKLNFPPDFFVYDPSITDKVSRSAGGLSGSKSFDYLIVPRNPGEYKLPVVSFSFFDPNKGTYVTRTSKEFVISVTGEAQQSTTHVTNIGKEDLELIGEDIRYIKSETTPFSPKDSSFLRSAGFWGLYLTPFLLFGFLVFWKQRQEKLAGDRAGMRSRKAQKLARKRLSVAQPYVQENNPKAFYKEISSAMWEYISDKLNIGRSELSRENVQEQLLSRGVSQEIIQRFTHLLDNCEMALFAPTTVEGGMDSTYQEAMQLIVDIENPLKEAVAV